MSDQTEVPSTTTNSDRGFTLIEILVVISTMAMLTAVLSAVIMVVLRTAPSSEVRSDDARSVRGLVTWIPQDVDAAPPDGFDTSTTAWPCAGSPQATDSYNVLSIEWRETTSVVSNYAAAYRYEFDGAEWHMNRYTCDDVATGTMTVARNHNLTSALLPWSASPVSVIMCDIEVVNGQCPLANQITTGDVRSLQIRLTREDGVVTTIDAAPKNPDEDLANDPLASTNAAPTLSQINYTHTMAPGDTDTLDLVATHNPQDSDSGDTISAAIDSSEPMPPGVTATTADPLLITITADPSLSPGTIATPIVLIVSDQRAGWVEATITINIANPPNVWPTVTQTTYNLQLAPLDTIVLPLDLTHGVFDANGDPLTVTVVSFPNSKFTSPTTAPADPLKLTVSVKNGAALGVAAPIELLIEDGRGGSVVAELSVTIIAASSNDAPTISGSADVAINMFAGDTTTLFLDASHGAFDPDADPIWATIDGGNPQPAGITTVLPGGLEVQVTADPTIVSGPVTLPVSLQILDPYGDYVNVTITITIMATPPPPSDCVLGTVSATPSPVARQGGGTAARRLNDDVTVTVTYTGSCDGLVLKYDTGDPTGLGVGTGRAFPPGSPSSIVVLAKGNGGTEKWAPGTHTLTVSTTSAVTPNAITTTLTVT